MSAVATRTRLWVVAMPWRLYSPNVTKSYHYAKLGKLRESEKQFGYALVMQCLPPLARVEVIGSERVRVTIQRSGPRRFDRDNNVGSMKGVIDGIAAALKHDDGDEEFFDWQYDQRIGPYMVELRIEVVNE